MKTIFLFLLFTLCLQANSAENRDTLFPNQWALQNNGQVILRKVSDLSRIEVKGIPGIDINWTDTSNYQAPNEEIIVAVLDSGLDIEHPDLKGRITDTKWNFLDGNINVADDMGHGTHVAGVIAANKNTIGIVGAADSRIKIMPIKVLSTQVNGFVYKGKLITDIIADAMVFAIQNGAKVINLSLGWPKLVDTLRVRNAFQMAEDKNVLVVAASGNNNKDLPTFPCAYETVVCVGAIDNRGELTDFSNHGSKVDMVAPGEYIVSTLPRLIESRVMRIKNYEVKSGSSQAAPFVTAALATLKLFNPNMTNEHARSVLFQTARSLNNENKRFVKFGMLDMKSMLNSTSVLAEKSFLIPMLKNVTEIHFNKSDLRFKINLPLKNISQQAFTGIVCADLQSDNVTLDQNCFDVKDIKDSGKVELALTGTIRKINSDSHIILKITIDGKSYLSTVVFTRNLNADSELQSFPIANASFSDMALISGERKLSRMVRVLDKFHKLNFPEYYFMEKNKQTASATVISLLTKENGKHVIKSILLPRVTKVLSIHRQDINLDGNLDYFIYALSADQKELLIVNLSQNLTPVFGKFSTWAFPLSTFEGLPIDGGQERFDWVAVTNKDLGRILVPSFYKAFELPELDNSKNILDRVVGKTPRLFFLNPSIVDNKVTLESRVFDSVQTMKILRKKLQLFSDQSLTLLKSIPQSVEQYSAGTIHALFSSSDENSSKFFEVLFSDKDMRINPIKTNLSISDSLIYPVVNSSDFILTTLLNRSSAEYLLLNQSEISTQSIVKQNWENPILNMIGAFNQNGEKLLFIESRYTISLTREGLASLDLPVYRDSSFPGANFSETLTPLLADGLPGVFVNSTLIFGERLYVMVAEENQFIRPMNLSVAIPDGCVPLTPEALEIHENYNFAFLCSDSSQNVTLKFLPML